MSIVYYIIILLLIGLFLFWRFVYFFRDPKRNIPNAEIISPADGKIIYLKEVKNGEVPISVKGKNTIVLDDMLKSKKKTSLNGTLIGIYLSITDVHYQRSPIAGEVKDVWYHKTGFNYSFYRMFFRKYLGLKPVYKNSKHLLENERNIIHIKNDKHDCYVVQIADKVVNRIDCYVKPGDTVKLGQKIGLIKMGSQVDLFITNSKPVDFKDFKVGIKIYGGSTKLK